VSLSKQILLGLVAGVRWHWRDSDSADRTAGVCGRPGVRRAPAANPGSTVTLRVSSARTPAARAATASARPAAMILERIPNASCWFPGGTPESQDDLVEAQ
jgi:hypothetical protein